MKQICQIKVIISNIIETVHCGNMNGVSFACEITAAQLNIEYFSYLKYDRCRSQ